MRNLFSTSALAVLALASTASVAMAQETSSSIRGSVTAESGAPISGATVTVVHVPSGTTSTMITGESGAFSLSGLRPGGPYRITVKSGSYPDAVYNDVSLTVGQPYNVPITMATSVEELVVSAVRPTQALSTNFTRERIEGVTSINRDIRDIARQDPFASFNPVTRAVTIAGTRPTTNKFSVDGVRFSDNFGLAGGGLPTNKGPVPVDAVEQLSVKVAPYDISEGDFQGGAINVVLRSGENNFTGSAYYSYTDDSLQGHNYRGTAQPYTLTNKNYGGFLSGPIIKDKLFFAASYEKLDAVAPANFGLAGAANVVPLLTQAKVDFLNNIAKTVYNYDTLGIGTTLPETDQKYTIKIDYNINDMHRLSYTYIHDKGETEALGGSSSSATTPAIGLQGIATHEPQIVDSHVLQFNSNWTNNFSTETRVNWRKANQTPVAYSSPGFAQFTVCDGPNDGNFSSCQTNGTALKYVFGTEQFSQADVVGQTSYGADFVGRYNMGNHVFKGEFGFQRLEILNVFTDSALGVYTFDSLADFQAKRAASLSYQYSSTGTLSDAFASFSYDQYNIGLQDSWDITPRINLMYGIRADLYTMKDQAALNPAFTLRNGFVNNYNIDGNIVAQPRAQLTWRTTDRLTMHAGVGLFNGGAPDVYIGNSFSRNGVRTNLISITRAPVTGALAGNPATSPAVCQDATYASICDAALNNVNGFVIDPTVKTFLTTNTASQAAAPVAALDKDFKVAQTWKYTLSADYKADLTKFKLGDGWRFGGDIYYGKVQEAAYYTDLRLTKVGVAPDGRPIYKELTATSTPTTPTIQTTSDANYDLLEKNDSQGHSLVLIARGSKAFDFGLITSMSYAFSDVTSFADMGGSTASGTYGAQAAQDPNLPTYGRSDYEVRHDLKANLDYSHNWFGDNATRVSVYGEYRTGAPYSLTMNVGGSSTTRNIFGTTQSTNKYLLYVPKVDSITADPLVVYGNPLVVGDDVATFNNVKNLVLSRNLTQGAIIGKNTEFSPDYFKVDMHLEQEVPTFLGSSKVKVYADIENLLNMINNKYGSYRTVGSLQPVVAVSCVASGANACAQYRYTTFANPTVTNNQRQSLWAVRVGARFEF